MFVKQAASQLVLCPRIIAMGRAINGVAMPRFYKGEQMGKDWAMPALPLFAGIGYAADTVTTHCRPDKAGKHSSPFASTIFQTDKQLLGSIGAVNQTESLTT